MKGCVDISIYNYQATILYFYKKILNLYDDQFFEILTILYGNRNTIISLMTKN